MVLGYASELEDDDALTTEARRQAGMIRRQGERLKSLVEDLNLTTKLEYALQPIRREAVDLVEIGRQAVSEVLNSGLPEQYEIEFSEEHPGRAARTAVSYTHLDVYKRQSQRRRANKTRCVPAIP